MGEMTSMTIRAREEEIERFKDLARNRNISQGDLFKTLMDEFEKLDEDTDAKGIEVLNVGNVNDNKILIKENNIIRKVIKEPKTYSFTGKVVTYLPFPRQCYEFSYSQLKEELGFEMVYGKYKPSYQFCIYEMDKEKKFLVYEYICVMDIEKNFAVSVVRRAKFANNLYEILQILGAHISMNEAENIEFALAEDISGNDKLIKKYIS
ncbi:MAG: hypothetical protein ACRCW0_10455 [Clostridium sp.]